MICGIIHSDRRGSITEARVIDQHPMHDDGDFDLQQLARGEERRRFLRSDRPAMHCGTSQPHQLRDSARVVAVSIGKSISRFYCYLFTVIWSESNM